MIPHYKILQRAIIAIGLNFISLLYSCNKTDVEQTTTSDLNCIVSDLQFAEGPTYYNGNLYFSDIEANTIYKWNETDGLTTFKSNSGGANGLYFSPSGTLNVCQGGNKRIVSIEGDQTIEITSTYNGKPYNEPNDLWRSPSGNLYFTDPNFTSTLTQDGENVYCVLASTGEVIRVINDLTKPNGIVGNYEGTLLYVADYGASKIYRYTILTSGTLSTKQLFANVQADGLSIDEDGNLYTASSKVMKFSPQGALLDTFSLPGTITNLFYVNSNPSKLFITTHNEVYLKYFE